MNCSTVVIQPEVGRDSAVGILSQDTAQVDGHLARADQFSNAGLGTKLVETDAEFGGNGPGDLREARWGLAADGVERRERKFACDRNFGGPGGRVQPSKLSGQVAQRASQGAREQFGHIRRQSDLQGTGQKTEE